MIIFGISITVDSYVSKWIYFNIFNQKFIFRSSYPTYVITARSKGLTERKVLYGHVFRNAMLIVIAGFPSAFIEYFFKFFIY